MLQTAVPLLAALCLALAPLPFPKPGRADDALRDLEAMQGVWTERFADSAAVTVAGHRMQYHPDHVWKLTLDTKLNPSRISATGVGAQNAGQTRWGLYRLEKGKLIICWDQGTAARLAWPSSLEGFHKDVWIEVFTLVKR
jgi:uncharacterized protein (TIGR03067 family)